MSTTRHTPFVSFLLTCLLGLSPAALAQSGEIRAIEDSVVKIYTTAAAPDYFTPWRLLTPRQSSGSGSVIEGNRILTNAHVVADASYVQAQKFNDPQRYAARVLFISHEADLALLTVDDPSFFADTEALALGGLPNPHEEVSVFGYPIGGNTLSITKGILSRVEHQVYAHASSFLLAGQIDAAINPGNSGGPVIKDGRIVGVVMQANSGGRAENLGYFVPPTVIKHVLRDANNDDEPGFPDLGFRTQTLDSPAARHAYGLKDEQRGVLVIKVFADSPAAGLLKENDVILRLDSFDVADDGSIHVNEDVRTDYKYAIDLHHIGEDVAVTIARKGRVSTVNIKAMPASQSYNLVAGEQYDQIPKYYIYGGVLFVPLNMNLIMRWGSDWSRTAPVNLLQARNEWSSPERQELVVALQVLAAEVNLGYHDWRNWIVDYVNGEPVRDFDHFVELVRSNTEENVVFENTNGYQMIINHRDALSQERDILTRYRIPSSYPAGLLESRCEQGC